MSDDRSSTGRRSARSLLFATLLCAAPFGVARSGDQLPNNFPFLNQAGTAATYSTAGFVDLDNPFHTLRGPKGRSCESCHLPQAGWSIRPIDIELKFFLSGGEDPIFNPLDANTSSPADDTWAQRYASYSMLRKGLFRRGGPLSQNAEFEIIAVDDPLGAGGNTARFVAFRRPLATANFHIARNVGWHDQFTNSAEAGAVDVPTGLRRQALATITGAHEDSTPSDAALDAIVGYEMGLSFAQQSVFGLGSLSSCGAQGGPENLSLQPPVNARFNLFDAWIGLVPGSCGTKPADRKRAQIARGQELFNTSTNANGGTCRGCHNAANNGSRVDGRLFNVKASEAQFREPGMPLYTLRHKVTGELKQTTDPGRAIRSGLWIDIDQFKTPSLRGVVARAPYFHNGIAKTLEDVVRHYEKVFGFKYTEQERQDLVAFLEAL